MDPGTTRSFRLNLLFYVVKFSGSWFSFWCGLKMKPLPKASPIGQAIAPWRKDILSSVAGWEPPKMMGKEQNHGCLPSCYITYPPGAHGTQVSIIPAPDLCHNMHSKLTSTSDWSSSSPSLLRIHLPMHMTVAVPVTTYFFWLCAYHGTLHLGSV